MIICAAIKIEHTDVMGCSLEPLIVCGHRHGDCYNIKNRLDMSIDSIVEGFIDHRGVFFDRKEAFIQAKECGQLCKHTRWYRVDNEVPNELYSEDLY